MGYMQSISNAFQSNNPFKKTETGEYNYQAIKIAAAATGALVTTTVLWRMYSNRAEVREESSPLAPQSPTPKGSRPASPQLENPESQNPSSPGHIRSKTVSTNPLNPNQEESPKQQNRT